MQTITINESSASLRRIPFVCELPAARNETQEIDLGDINTADTFTLTFEGQTTGAITYAADMTSAITTALEALSNVAPGEATVVKGTGQVYEVTFSGQWAALDVDLMTINSPTTFTPVGVTEVAHGGVDGAPARLLTFAAADIQISKNGGAVANSAGTVVEVGNGLYYYQATAGEVDTAGFLTAAVVRTDVAITFPTVQITLSSDVEGLDVLATGTAQSGTAGTIRLASGETTTSDYYVPVLCVITSGTGAKQSRIAYAYDGATKDLYVEPNWIVPPASDSLYALLAVSPLMADVLRANHALPDSFGEVASKEDVALEVLSTITDDDTPFSGADIAAIESRLPAALVSGRMSSDAVAISGSTTTADLLEAHADGVVRVEMAAGCTTTSLVLEASPAGGYAAPSTANDTYIGRSVVMLSGTLRHQAAEITDYVGSTRTLTVTALTGSAADGDTAIIV